MILISRMLVAVKNDQATTASPNGVAVLARG